MPHSSLQKAISDKTALLIRSRAFNRSSTCIPEEKESVTVIAASASMRTPPMVLRMMPFAKLMRQTSG
jgi:hypothetical protein